MGTSIFSRKRDLLYLIHFSINLPLMFMMDMQALYPPSIVPAFAVNLKNWYVDTYHDDFFVNTPPWFTLFVVFEVIWQVPSMIWAIGGLYRDSPKVPLVLLPFACLYFISTAVCMVEYFYWDVPMQQKIDLTTLYAPYLALAAFMGVDMYLRLSDTVKRASTASSMAGQKKKQ